jgi:hypothetical protein
MEGISTLARAEIGVDGETIDADWSSKRFEFE